MWERVGLLATTTDGQRVRADEGGQSGRGECRGLFWASGRSVSSFRCCNSKESLLSYAEYEATREAPDGERLIGLLRAEAGRLRLW